MRIRNATIEWGLARVAVRASHLLFSTMRRTYQQAEPNSNPYLPISGQTYIYSVWHDSLMMPLFLDRQPATMALVGLHQDGGFLAHVLTSLGISAVRGSSSRGGPQAVRQLVQDSRNHHIVVTPDGPRGPRRQMKEGVAYLASRTGKPVIPTAFVCRRSWSVGTGWTNLVIPQPWTHIYAVTGTPIPVPADASRDELADCTHKIQQAMEQMDSAALTLCGRAVSPDVSESTRQQPVENKDLPAEAAGGIENSQSR